ncbi:MAG: branched-chain amino acid ABC transporter permease [Pseudorhodoplanes sp.]
MNTTIALLLAQDGLTNGVIYALLAVAILLVFVVTRILFVPQGEFVVLGAITLGQLQRGQEAGAVWLLAAMAALAIVIEAIRSLKSGDWRTWMLRAGFCLASLAVAALLARFALGSSSLPLQILTVLCLVAPMGPMLYWTAFRDIAHASVLTLLFAAVAVHYVLQGLMLPLFGAEGFRLEPFVQGRIDIGVTRLSLQFLLVAFAFVMLVAALWLFFRSTLPGKILRATSVNRIGARLVGISPDLSGAAAFGLASLIGAISGILIAPLTTIYYDSGFLLALKGFVGAVVGGLASFPLAALGSLLVGVLESISSFYASALKDSLVFAALIPILLYMSIAQLSGRGGEEHEE